MHYSYQQETASASSETYPQPTVVAQSEQVHTYTTQSQQGSYNFSFQYPTSWKTYTNDSNNVFIIKDTTSSINSFNTDVVDQHKTYILISTSKETVSTTTLAKNSHLDSIDMVPVNGTNAIVLVTRDIGTSSEETGYKTISYILSSPRLTSDEHLIISLRPYFPDQYPSDISSLKKIVNSFAISNTNESNKSTDDTSYIISTSTLSFSDYQKRDVLIKQKLQKQQTEAELYRQKNATYIGLCGDTEVAKILSLGQAAIPSHCLAFDNSYLITIKLNLDGYYCIDSNGNALIVSEYQNKRSFSQNPLSCKVRTY